MFCQCTVLDHLLREWVAKQLEHQGDSPYSFPYIGKVIGTDFLEFL